MTRAVARGDHDAAIRSERVFMAALVMLWLATCAVAAIALYAFPGLILKPTLDHRLVMIAVGLCALLSLVQCVQTPMSVMTQARKARSEEHTSELQSLMRISYAVFCLKKKKNKK